MRRARRVVGLAALVGACALAHDAGTALGQVPNPNSKLCFTNVIGVPGPFFRRPPKIDGCLRECAYPEDAPNQTQHDDFGWQGAFQFVANQLDSPGPPAGDVVTQGIYDPSGHVYLSFEVHKDLAINDLDAVVIGMKGVPNGVVGDYSLLVIFPFSNHAGAPYNGPVGEIQFFRGTKSGANIVWDTANFVKGPDWVTAAVTAGGGASFTWTVEVDIKRMTNVEGEAMKGIALSANGFDFFFDVIRLSSDNFEGFDAPWPPAATPGNALGTPAAPTIDKWGTATINTGVCGGVSFQATDIKTNQPDPSLINTAGPNIFSVTLKNTSIDTRVTPNVPAIAKGVTAKFRIANFGLPADLSWAPIPGGNNVSNTADVPAATGNPLVPGTVTLSTPAPGWIPDAAWITGNNNHQCVLAELSSPNTDVLFVNKSVYRNLHYGTNPGFKPVAFIDGRWGDLPPGKAAHTIDILKISTFQYAYGDNTVKDIPIGKLAAQVQLTFLGYRHTGRFVILGGKKIEIVTAIGSFGYLVQHQLPDVFEREFTRRHDALLKAGINTKEPAEQMWARINQRLRNDPERPTEKDWNLDFPGFKSVLKSNDSLVRIEVPKDQVSRIDGAISYTGGTGGSGPSVGCCPGQSGNTTPAKVGTLGLPLLVGAVILRRRRRR